MSVRLPGLLDAQLNEIARLQPTAGSVTLDHGPIAALEWPAMTMGFSANPKILKDIAVGDRVAFELDWDGKAGVVTQIAKTGTTKP